MRCSFSSSGYNSIRSVLGSSLVPRRVEDDPVAAVAGVVYSEPGGMIRDLFLLVASSVVEVFIIVRGGGLTRR